MRIAILPICSFRNLSGESEIVMFSNQIHDWVMKHEDVWVYFVLPKDCEPQGWVGEREGWPRCSVLWEDALGLYYDKLTDVPRTFLEMFDPRQGELQIDLLVTSRRAAAVQYARQLWDHRLKQTLPVVIDESMTVEWGRTPSTVSDIEVVAQTLGYAIGYPVWDTASQRQNALDAARHWLAGSRVLSVMEKGVVIPCGFDPNRTRQALAEQGIKPIKEIGSEFSPGLLADQKNERFTCFFGGRLNRGSKRADILLREYDSFFKFGRDVDVTVCSPKDEGWILDMIRKEYPEINVLVQTPSDEFKVRASKAHVFLNTSASEGFSVGFAEMMYMTKFGTVLLAPRLGWTKGMFEDQYDDYPFLYEDFEQARVMLRWVHENYEEAVKESCWLGDWVADRYDMEKTNEQHHQHYQGIVNSHLDMEFVRMLMSESNRELVVEAFNEMPKSFLVDDLYVKMIEMSRAMKEEPRRGQTTKLIVRRWLILSGLAYDSYDSARPRLVKTGVVG